MSDLAMQSPHDFCLFNDPATTEIYTLSLHDALPILRLRHGPAGQPAAGRLLGGSGQGRGATGSERGEQGGLDKAAHGFTDRKSTRLNSSHPSISYAVFCLKKKNKTKAYYIHSPDT